MMWQVSYNVVKGAYPIQWLFTYDYFVFFCFFSFFFFFFFFFVVFFFVIDIIFRRLISVYWSHRTFD